jgi:hypothetical protein
MIHPDSYFTCYECRYWSHNTTDAVFCHRSVGICLLTGQPACGSESCEGGESLPLDFEPSYEVSSTHI